jgi:hypothetical protein
MTKPTVGQEVAIQGSYSYDNYRFGYVVAKVTPSGQVVVRRTADGHEQRFDKNGYEMDSLSSKYHRDQLVVDVDAARAHLSNVNAKRTAAAAINAVRGDAGRYNDKESLLKQLATLAELLEVARLAVEEVK